MIGTSIGRFFAAGSLLLVAGCSENSLHSVKENLGPLGPVIEVDPAQLVFGRLVKDEVEGNTFTIHSVGDEILEVEGIWIESGVGAFVVADTTSYSLAPGESADIDVSFTPMAANENLAQAIVSSNDNLVPEAAVDLVGYGSVPELSINPDPYDFGNTYVGCPHDGDMALTNVGTAPLQLFDIGHAATDFTLTHDLTLPHVLAPTESAMVHMEFNPSLEGSYSGTLAVVSNEPMGTRNATQTGEGKYAAELSDHWELLEDPPSDIMFLIDQSCSMYDDQARLANNFSAFISTLDTYTQNWHIMVVNNDNGCNNSGILTSTTGGYQNSFTNAVYAGGGQYTESLLTPASRAVENTDAGECNQGFMRPNAMVHIIMVSDEPEQSSGSWDSYVNQVIAKKGNPSLVRMSAIAGDYPNGCGGNSAGYGYYEAVNYTGGVYLSICASSWTQYMATLAHASINQDTFILSTAAVESTVEVYRNGVQETGTWHYDASLEAVVFDSNVPEGGDEIDIDYAVLATCD